MPELYQLPWDASWNTIVTSFFSTFNILTTSSVIASASLSFSLCVLPEYISTVTIGMSNAVTLTEDKILVIWLRLSSRKAQNWREFSVRTDRNRLLPMRPAVIIFGVFRGKWSSALLGVCFKPALFRSKKRLRPVQISWKIFLLVI